MGALLIILIAVGGFFAYKKFGPKKEVKQAPPASKEIKSTSTKKGSGGAGSTVKTDDGLIHPRGDSEYYKQNRL